ncbi:DUF998 domain-containing protein [Streptomyces sp. BH-SS-21]|uniref:DUF998 domain-containing protein n=1 Tax=Streptomyces liliiviolaceus TaxID=2823109 RepID=A0A940XTB0_9ACTN|nr:DUF998 domain-containing protein [Streptomyces liliiviolaceus]MBQ0849530.1 DUF998 domain-containing protein [Streptomyces liliiviolaceus]
MITPRPAATATLLALAALTYSAWTLETFLGTSLPPPHTYVSELAATNQPYSTLFRTADLLAGTLVCAAAATATATLSARRIPRTARAALLLFGAATAVDSRLPLSCTPTTDPACAARETAAQVPWTHSAHTVSSTLALCGILVAMATLTRTARAGRALLALELAATAWTLAAIAALETGHDGWGVGIAQRLQVGVIAIWLGALAVTLLHTREPAERVPATHEPATHEPATRGALRRADARP